MALLPTIPDLASLAVRKAMDTLFPPRCYACQRITGGQGGLCAECWEKIEFIARPCCARCGAPFPYDMGSPQVACMPCLADPPPYAMARAVFCYNEGSRALISGYKYHDRTHATPMFAAWLARAAAELLPETDLILPVPLHRWRLIGRRYNQSALLARGLAKAVGKPVLLGGLARIRHTPRQVGLTRAQRILNVDGAFAVPPHYAAALQGKTVLLVDDVLTTGATLNACTRTLLEAGVTQVYLLTLARTVGEEL